MSLPTLAGVQSRIHNIPGHPQFMIIREMADALGLEAASLRRSFHRNKHKFPNGYFFVLTPEEYKVQSRHSVTTAERSRTDLDQYAFTEKGALYLLRFVTGEKADAGAIMLIDAFAALRDQLASDVATSLWRFQQKWIAQRQAVRSRIISAVEKGIDWHGLKSALRTIPQWELVMEIRESILFGAIKEPPKGTPMHLRQPLPKPKAVTPDTDPRQLSMLEG